MTVDSEAIFALMEHRRHDATGAVRDARRDGSRVARRARRRHPLPRARASSAAVARPAPADGLYFASTRRALAIAAAALKTRLDVHEVREGRLLHVVDGRVVRRTALPARSPVSRVRLPPARPGATRGRVVPRAPRGARLNQPRLAFRPGRTSTPSSQEPLAHEVLERRPGAARDIEQSVDLPLGQKRRIRASRLRPVGHLRQTSQGEREGRALRDCPLETLFALEHLEPGLAERVAERAERVRIQRGGRERAPARGEVTRGRRSPELVAEACGAARAARRA